MILSYAIKNPIMVVIPNNRNIPPAEKDCAKATTQVKNATVRKIPSYSHDMCYNRIIHMLFYHLLYFYQRQEYMINKNTKQQFCKLARISIILNIVTSAIRT